MSGSWWETLLATTKVGIGIIFIAGALQRYLLGLGLLARKGVVGIIGRILMAIGGGLIALPTTEVIGIDVGQLALFISGSLAAVFGAILSLGHSGQPDKV